MKELSLEEVLRIAGGVPLSAALDELTYRAPAEEPADVEAARFACLIRPSPFDPQAAARFRPPTMKEFENA